MKTRLVAILGLAGLCLLALGCVLTTPNIPYDTIATADTCILSNNWNVCKAVRESQEAWTYVSDVSDDGEKKDNWTLPNGTTGDCEEWAFYFCATQVPAGVNCWIVILYPKDAEEGHALLALEDANKVYLLDNGNRLPRTVVGPYGSTRDLVEDMTEKEERMVDMRRLEPNTAAWTPEYLEGLRAQFFGKRTSGSE